MATYLLQLNLLSKKLLSGGFSFNLGSFRNASKKSGTSRPKKASRSRPGRFGVKKSDNSLVHAGSILVHQKKLDACPGLNVGIGRIADLYAKTSGRVVITYEKTNFNTKNHLVSREYPNSLPKYKTYFNVIPNTQHNRFKLVDTF